MGQYNPHAPYILGQEWVPIRNAHYVPDGVTERGYTFTIDAVTVPVSGAFYVEETPQNLVSNACEFISVYPAGREALTGPIKKVTIPVSGLNVVNPGGIDISEGITALHSNQDALYVFFFGNSGVLSLLDISFDTSSYAELLLGKRIVDVRLRYTFISSNVTAGDFIQLRIVNPAAFDPIIYPQTIFVSGTEALSVVSSVSLGELTQAWDPNVNFDRQRTVLPWRFQELNRFRAGAAAGEALVVELSNAADSPGALLDYVALEVYYCEETRVLYGGFKTIDTSSIPSGVPLEIYHVGAIATRLYNPVTHTQGATLPAGSYTVTSYHRDLASESFLQGAPRLQALREYYALPHQLNVRINQTTVVGDTFSVEDNDDVLTQLTLHTATQIVTGCHPYGTQYGAPVYGSRTVTQEIEDNPANSTPYSQVRFYARRYGNTTVPLTLADVATGLSTVSISVSEFDALDEIVDGWREVTLRFATAPTMAPTTDDVDWRWSASGELTGNQWQIMIADGPTGAWGPLPAAAATGPATYWAPLGSQVALTWQSPSVSGVAADTTSDAVLIFSQDPPAVTGLAIEVAEQELTAAIGCDSTPACVPTALDYLELTWTTNSLCDTFDDRESASGWLTSTSGDAYTHIGGLTTDYTVVDGEGFILGGSAALRRAIAGPAFADGRVQVTVRPTVLATGSSFEPGAVLRYVDDLNFWTAELRFLTTGLMNLRFIQTLAGAATSVANVNLTGSYAPSTRMKILFEIEGSSLRAKAWEDAIGVIVPPQWQLMHTDTDIAGAGRSGVSLRVQLANTNAGLNVAYDDLSSSALDFVDTHLELQRSDDYTDWQTVMLTSTPCRHFYRDYEARIGVVSRYRLRTLNALNFAGPWVTGSGTIPAPGVTVAGDANSLLTFTSNALPESSLAYVMQFENRPIETFTFPEADFVALQRLFGRDFYLAIRPLERGGERFRRTLLVNTAAIALPSLANFRDLRDLAWADVDYVCVRDELGNRWFATVLVPDAGVRGDRTIYLAQIEVVQMTDTATPLDPS